MKYFTSYFYKIRFFKKNMIPISTAIWDPKWFHEFKGSKHIWKDSNGVYNGIRFEELNPQSCHAFGCPCRFRNTGQGYQTCQFLKEYREGLSKIDFDKLISNCEKLGEFIKSKENIDEEIYIVFIFHEANDNPCSERVPLQELFRSHNIEINEFK